MMTSSTGRQPTSATFGAQRGAVSSSEANNNPSTNDATRESCLCTTRGRHSEDEDFISDAEVDEEVNGDSGDNRSVDSRW